jgi:hypothetical protein
MKKETITKQENTHENVFSLQSHFYSEVIFSRDKSLFLQPLLKNHGNFFWVGKREGKEAEEEEKPFFGFHNFLSCTTCFDVYVYFGV